jgi:hypothetical protein
MVLKFRRVADPPDVIARAVLVRVRPVHLSPGELAAEGDRFEDRAVAEPATTDVVNLSHARLREELTERGNQIRTVDVVADLLSLVAVNGVRRSCHRAFHQIRQEAM